MNKRDIGIIGAFIGFSIALIAIIMTDKQLKKEARGQVESVLTSTKRVVNHYRNISEAIAPAANETTTATVTAQNAWDNTIEKMKKHAD